ncbi:MAG TPA: hypothetical protein VH879_14660 [Gemmatimonadales bacterium]
MFLPLVLLVAVAQAPADSSAFSDSRTESLIRGAITRHSSEDQAVRDYTAQFRYRLSFGLGRRRWAQVPNAAVEEQEGRVQWVAPNDLKVDILGRRASARSSELRLSSRFDQPWFVPRSLSDSVRVFGNEIPPRAALHPLAADGPDWYRYRLTDSVGLTTPGGRRLTLLGVEVLPRRTGPSLVAGRLWLDTGRLDLVRCSFRFVGSELWLDPEDLKENPSSARRASRIVSRILTLDADLEYALQEERYWMPFHQVVSGRVELPWFGDLVIPFEATTTFDDYDINRGATIAFSIPLPPEVSDPDSVRALLRARRDSIREDRRRRYRDGGLREDDSPQDDAGRWADGRFEIHRAPADSLRAYDGWGDVLSLRDDPAADREVREIQADLERLAVGLPAELTGRRQHGFTWERLVDGFRYNRVQGLAPSLGYQVQLPGDGFTTANAQVRYGFSDERVTGQLTIVREAPGARWSLSGYRDLRSNDPFALGNGFGNSLNAVFTGHDDADYHLAHGARLTREGSLGPGIELTTALVLEHEGSVRREARSWLNDALGGTGDFPPNPPVTDGTYGGVVFRLDAGMLRSRLSIGGDVLGGSTGPTTARVYGSLRRKLWHLGGNVTGLVSAGIATATPLPQQAFRLGGVATVRGFDYGARRGQAFWVAQLDWPLTRGLFQPVLFADAGQAGSLEDLFSSRTLAGGGAGLALLGGLLRFDLSYPLTSGGSGVRLDLQARGIL